MIRRLHKFLLTAGVLCVCSYAYAAEPESGAADKTATWDYSVTTVMDATMALSGSSTEGTVNAVEDNGLAMTVIANGASFRNNGNNIQVRKGAEFRIPVVSVEDVVTVKGYPGYSYYSISGSEEYKNDSNNPETTYKAKYSDVNRGYVSLVSTNDNNYYYSIKVEQKSPRQPIVLDNESATATFAFNLGTDGQRAVFSNDDYFLSSKVVYGDFAIGLDNKNLGQTTFKPAVQDKAADDKNLIRFNIQPKFGFKFTPVKVSFKATRYGTDGGKLDIAWVNPDNSRVSLAKGVKAQRDNATPNVSDFEYTITGATAGEGPCGLAINIYELGNTKSLGFSDVVIEGTLTGTEKEVPIMESFAANGKTYIAEDIFEMDGDAYAARIYLASSLPMISASNPVTDIKVIKGDAGDVTYSGDNNSCTATIPLKLNDISVNYVVKFVRKPLHTITYYNTDGSVMGTQKVEEDTPITAFACDYTTAKADEGTKVRGWFATSTGGSKYTVESIITEPVKLYAWASEIEVESTHRKYNFDLTSATFYPEDHEAFNTTAGYYHDATHGWAFKPGDRIDLLVGPKASISIGLCRYGSATGITVTDAAGNTLATLPGKSQTETDGEVTAYNYEGTGGTVSLTFEGTGELYLHNVKIMNTTETNYTKNGDWYYVKPGNAQSLLDVIEAVSANNAAADSPRSYIFVPDGTYDLKQTVLTNLSGHNISLIGQSMAGTVIVNAPLNINEGINKTATLMNTGSGNYLQDLTLKNALDYYGGISSGAGAGRAVAWWDKGVKTICKNVTLLSYQDTYYTNNPNGTYYWETSDIHGTVDFICGEGTLFMENSTLTVEKRNPNGKGGCTLTAPSTKAGNRYGYVFSNCRIDNYAENYNLGRAWSNEPRCAYINTTVSDNKLVSSRWTSGGMNVCAKEFVEYNTKDTNGNVVSPSSKVIEFTKDAAKNKMETILTAAQAAEFTVEKVFGDWAPASKTVQIAAPAAVLNAGTMTWKAVEGAKAYAIFHNGKFVAVTDGTSLEVEAPGEGYTIRSANEMGGLGQEAAVEYSQSGITGIDADSRVVATVYYNMQGMRVTPEYKGVVIRIDTLDNGSTVTTKTVNL